MAIQKNIFICIISVIITYLFSRNNYLYYYFFFLLIRYRVVLENTHDGNVVVFRIDCYRHVGQHMRHYLCIQKHQGPAEI